MALNSEQLQRATLDARERRAVDVLRCDGGDKHDVRMEWAKVNGVRLGHLVAWCRTCGRAIPPKPMVQPTTSAEMRERRQAARLTQVTRRQDAQARREYILSALAQGEQQIDIAVRLGVSKQRLNAIIRGCRNA